MAAPPPKNFVQNSLLFSHKCKCPPQIVPHSIWFQSRSHVKSQPALITTCRKRRFIEAVQTYQRRRGGDEKQHICVWENITGSAEQRRKIFLMDFTCTEVREETVQMYTTVERPELPRHPPGCLELSLSVEGAASKVCRKYGAVSLGWPWWSKHIQNHREQRENRIIVYKTIQCCHKHGSIYKRDSRKWERTSQQAPLNAAPSGFNLTMWLKLDE